MRKMVAVTKGRNYGAAAVCLFGALEVLAAVAPEAFAPLWQQPKLHAMAEFIERFMWRINIISILRLFPCSSRRTGREYHFAKQMQLSNLMAFAAEDFQKTLTQICWMMLTYPAELTSIIWFCKYLVRRKFLAVPCSIIL